MKDYEKYAVGGLVAIIILLALSNLVPTRQEDAPEPPPDFLGTVNQLREYFETDAYNARIVVAERADQCIREKAGMPLPTIVGEYAVETLIYSIEEYTSDRREFMKEFRSSVREQKSDIEEQIGYMRPDEQAATQLTRITVAGGQMDIITCIYLKLVDEGLVAPIPEQTETTAPEPQQ